MEIFYFFTRLQNLEKSKIKIAFHEVKMDEIYQQLSDISDVIDEINVGLYTNERYYDEFSDFREKFEKLFKKVKKDKKDDEILKLEAWKGK
jgi:hypothetical protein